MSVSLGFHYALFITDLTKRRVRIWFDGDENYSSYSVEEFLKLDPERYRDLYLACRESSYFLWGVAEKAISRVSFKQTPESLRAEMSQKAAEARTAEENNTEPAVADNYWRSSSENIDKNPQVNVR
jgi:hypothetical protein